ncbi:MAG TPA: hypothetical protein VEB20_11335, partial [Azospirillaceae bacterium]|nr:hypothetical protein [Azospirillaceae bacterium]
MSAPGSPSAQAGHGSWAGLGLALVFLLAMSHYAGIAATLLPAFDGALNLNVARELAETGRYASYYNDLHFFPVETQTNAPYVLPAALLYALFGVGIFTSQAVNLAYVAALAVACCLLVGRRHGALAGAAAILLALQVPGAPEYGMLGYGEFPSLFWLLAALLALEPALAEPGQARTGRALAGGAALALSFLTKTVALIWVAPVTVLVVLLLLWRRAPLRMLAWFLAGLALPVLGWELFRLVQLGGPAPYHAWWEEQLYEIFAQSGVSDELQDTPGLLPKLATHLGLLSGFTGMPVPAVAAFLVLPQLVLLAPAWAAFRRRDAAALLVLVTVAGVAFLYSVWWLGISPTQQAWLRRIMNGLVLQQLAGLLALGWIAGEVRRRAAAARAAGGLAAALLAVPMGWMAWNAAVIGRPVAAPAHEAEVLEAARVVASLPQETRIFGFGWWRAPVVALFSGRRIDDLEQWHDEELAALPAMAVVTDHYAQGLAADAIRRRLEGLEVRPLFTSDGASVYAARKPAADPARWPEESLAAGLDFGRGDYPAISGFHDLEPGLRWSPGRSTVVLRRDAQRYLTLSVTVPTVARFKEQGLGPQAGVALTVAAGPCPPAVLPVERDGHLGATLEL